jgi:hypothetical protein
LLVHSALPAGEALLVHSALTAGEALLVHSALPAGEALLMHSALPAGEALLMHSALPAREALLTQPTLLAVRTCRVSGQSSRPLIRHCRQMPPRRGNCWQISREPGENWVITCPTL